MSSRNQVSQETKTHQTPSKQQENSVEATPNKENTELLLPDSTKQQVADAIFLTSLLGYKLSVGPLPCFADDDPPTTQVQQLLDHVNADHENGERFNEALLRDRVLMLHSKYKELVEERRVKPDEKDLSTDSEKLIFMLSERIWDPEYDDYGFAELNINQEVAVSGNRQGLKDQDQEVFLFSSSTCEQEDDIATLMNLNLCGLSDEHSLANFINSNRKNRGCVNEACLRDKLLKLQTRYKDIVQEKGKNLDDEDFETYNEHLIFQLSNKVWGKEPDANV